MAYNYPYPQYCTIRNLYAMTKLKDLYQINTIEELGEVAKLCDEKEFDLLLEDLKGCLLSLRLVNSVHSDIAVPVQLTSFNWSPLPQFPDHLLETEGEGLVVTIEKEIEDEQDIDDPWYHSP